MSTVTPPPPTGTVTAPPPPPTATVASPPPNLQALAVGSRLDAAIIALRPGGAEIDTAHGKLALQTNFPLPREGAVQLQLIAKGGHLQFLITAIAGRSPVIGGRAAGLAASGAAGTALANAPGGGATAAAGAGGLAPAFSSPVTLTVGSQTTATLLQPFTPQTPAMAGSAAQGAAATGAPAAAATAGTGKSPTTAASGPARTAHAGPTPTAPSASPSAAAVGARPADGGIQPAPPLPAGSRFAVRITGVVPASQLASGGGLPASGSVSMAAGQTLTGVVISTGGGNQVVVQTHAGPIQLVTPSPVSPGTTVRFEITGSLPMPQNAAAEAVGKRAAQIILGAGKWPQLEEAVRTLQETGPPAAQHLLINSLTKPDSALAAGILIFMAAIRGGEIRSWLGDGPARVLQRLRPDLLGRMRDDFGQMGRLTADSPSEEWRAYPIPILNNGEIEQIRLFMARRRQRDEEEEEDENEDAGTRFLVDLDLSRIGRFQLDGLVYDRKKRFDLIVRTQYRLPPTVEQDIRGIFQQYTEISGAKGGLNFHAAPPNFVEVTAVSPGTGDFGLIV